mmetsp:Transcript_6891/g.22639  ORF Transcript_6891/g.22639 Transcript_6891/m.22639 type:complete len:318 (-) Transcript_6891:664-1617(-)
MASSVIAVSPGSTNITVADGMPTASSSRYAIEMLACWLSFVTFNLGWVAMTSPKVDRWRRMRFVCMMWPQQFLAIVSRFLVMRLVKLASWEGLDHPALYWPLLLPIGVFETWSIQAMADVFESRPVKPVCLKQVLNQLKITTAESIGVTVGYKIWPWVRIDDPTLESLLHATWRTFVFDIGLDIGFYTFHRVCHVNRALCCCRTSRHRHVREMSVATSRRHALPLAARAAPHRHGQRARSPSRARDLRGQPRRGDLHPGLVPHRVRAYRPALQLHPLRHRPPRLVGPPRRAARPYTNVVDRERPPSAHHSGGAQPRP